MDKDMLTYLYTTSGLSMQEIATISSCSLNKIVYWMNQHAIPRRSIGDAIFTKKHGMSDGFTIKNERTPEEDVLFGLGLGIYWGEGNKKNQHSVRMGNTDPVLVSTFVKFLVTLCGVAECEIRYGLQLFSDVSEEAALNFWKKQLNIARKQIMPTVNRIKSGKIGTYRVKNQFGVMTVYVFNKRLRDWLVNQLSMPR